MAINSTSILGVRVDRVTMDDIRENVKKCFQKKSILRKITSHPSLPDRVILPIVTINPEFVVLSHNQPVFKKVINHSYLSVPDGIGIRLAGLLMRRNTGERVTGLNLMDELTKIAAADNLTVGFLGGAHNAGLKTLDVFTQRYPYLLAWSSEYPIVDISFDKKGEYSLSCKPDIHELYQITSSSSLLAIRYSPENKRMSNTSEMRKANGEPSDSEYEQRTVNISLLDAISHTDILFVAFGAPKQELFIDSLENLSTDQPIDRSTTASFVHQTSNFQTFPAKRDHAPRDKPSNFKPIVAVGVGGAFDEIAGIVPRCPVWIERIGFKWLFRLLTQPWRWRRQLRLVVFTLLLLRSVFPPFRAKKPYEKWQISILED